MRDPVVDVKLHDLGIDHDQLHFVGRRLVQNAHDDRVDADRLAGTRRAGDEQVRHPGDIRHDCLAAQISADGKRELALGIPEFLGFQDIPQGDDGGVPVGHFDPDGGFPGDRRLDPDIDRRQAELDVIGKAYDLAHLDALFGLKLISCDGRSLADIGDRNIDAECPERLLKAVRRLLQFPVRLGGVGPCALLHQVKGRKTVFAVLPAPALSAHGGPAGRLIFLFAPVPVDFDIPELFFRDGFRSFFRHPVAPPGVRIRLPRDLVLRGRLLRSLYGCPRSTPRSRGGSALFSRSRIPLFSGIRTSLRVHRVERRYSARIRQIRPVQFL